MKAFPYVALLSAFLGVEAFAQKPCTGPGASFGITSYQCASCGIEQKAGKPMAFIFDSEPVVLQVHERSFFRAGDVILAVNGHPITTRAGADAFTYPLGTTEMLVRRGGDRLTISAVPASMCSDGPGFAQGAITNTRKDFRLVYDSTLHKTVGISNEETGRFGFALACTPSCTRTRASDSTVYWKYDGLPRVAIVKERGPADRAEIVTGDVVLEVDGNPITEEAGALKLLRSNTARDLTLKVRDVSGRTREAKLRHVGEWDKPNALSCDNRVLRIRNGTLYPVRVFVGHSFIGSVRPGPGTTLAIPPRATGAIEIRDRNGEQLAQRSVESQPGKPESPVVYLSDPAQGQRGGVAYSIECK